MVINITRAIIFTIAIIIITITVNYREESSMFVAKKVVAPISI